MRAPIIPPPKPKKVKKRRQRSLVLSLLGFGFAAAVVIFVVGSAVAGYMLMRASEDLPNYEKLAEYQPPVMTRIHANDGSLIAEYARERRIFVPINTVPKVVIEAFLSAEDSRFYEHGGLDFQGIARAVFKIVLDKAQGRSGRVQGASTITQQVAKNFLLTSDRTLDRKLKEAILAIRIERTFSKDKILELYLNEIYLGIGSYGVAAASLNYFDKELKDLTIEEAAYLATLAEGAQQLSSHQTYREGACPAQLDHRADVRERPHNERTGRGSARQAAGSQSAEIRRSDFCCRFLCRGSAPGIAGAVWRGRSLRRRHVGSNDARPEIAALSRARR